VDDADLLILHHLMNSGRMTWADLATRTGLTRQTVADRVQKLEEAGIIKSYAAIVDPEAVGATLTAFVAVTIERPEQCAPFLATIQAVPEVLECHHVAGEDSYLLKVRTGGTRGLERLITEKLKPVPGVVRTRTTIVLSTAKETAQPPLPAPGAAR
jgi:Lrp/AsnC family leucine-responsive transcriptional regulator